MIDSRLDPPDCSYEDYEPCPTCGRKYGEWSKCCCDINDHGCDAMMDIEGCEK